MNPGNKLFNYVGRIQPGFSFLEQRVIYLLKIECYVTNRNK